MIAEGKVGVQDVGNGTRNTLRLDTTGALVTASYGGSLADAAVNGRLFVVANQAAVAVTAGLTTTWTGLGVANPSGSGKLIVVHEFGWASDVINPAESAIGLMTSTDTGFAQAIAARNCRNGYSTGVAYCDDDAAIDTPVLERVCGSSLEGAINLQVGLNPSIVDLKGSIVLAPGRSVLTYHSIGGTASLMFHFLWEEIDE